MEKPTLIVMAAGMGSRYGGLKQVDAVDGDGNAILDYSLYDAKTAGFDRVIFVIQPQMEHDFRVHIGSKYEGLFEVGYAHQHIEDLPEGFSVPEGRVKPWGTGHAALSARRLIDGPFCVFNADDLYGRDAYVSMHRFLTQREKKNACAMIGYRVENTLTDNGFVSRGVCAMDGAGYLTGVVERVHVERADGGAVYSQPDGQSGFIPDGTIVSMNIWGCGPEIMPQLERGFARFLKEDLPADPARREYYLPNAIGELIREGAATVKVLPTRETWHGVTYREDKAPLMDALRAMKRSGYYPERLWEGRA